MKKFSREWKRSKKARKQRKYRYNAFLHIRHKLLGANLSKELRKKYGKRSLPLRTGDFVRIMRGSFKGKKGKIVRVNMKKLVCYVEGISRTKKDGTKVDIPLQPSNLQIIELVEDKKRIKK